MKMGRGEWEKHPFRIYCLPVTACIYIMRKKYLRFAMSDNQEHTSFNIRTEKVLKEAFVAAAKSQDRTASQLIREFMREYVRRNGQRDLFTR